MYVLLFVCYLCTSYHSPLTLAIWQGELLPVHVADKAGGCGEGGEEVEPSLCAGD